MGATSVTGKGNGAAYNLKGPGNNRSYFVPMVNPHIIAAGQATCNGSGVATLYIPTETSTAADYIALVTSTDGTARQVAASHSISSGIMTLILTSALAADVLDYIVVRLQGTTQVTE